MQGKLIDQAAEMVRPGGALVYSVCSLEAEEGEDVVQAFVERRTDFRIDAPTDLPMFVPVAPEGWVRILPGLLEREGGLDGFFMARLVRAG
jgi:16S rRNA (cytosine967-C5)-methyltransferase